MSESIEDQENLSDCYIFEKNDLNVVLQADAKVEDVEKFYDNAAEYWGKIPPTMNGMLGGFAKISPTDIIGSHAFLRRFISNRRGMIGTARAVDCGAGIGRITKRLLLPLFTHVDMVEQCQNFLDNAADFIGAEISRVTRICSGLQSFKPDPETYNLVWIQWVSGHLTDDDLVIFLQRCKLSLKKDGIIILKENTTSSGSLEFDKTDSSFTRDLPAIKRLIARAGLGILLCQRQRGFPKCLYHVHMIAIK